MGERPLIVPFQIETYVTNNKNTPDKNCAQISPDYTKAEYTSYLGGKLEPAPFTAPSPLRAGVHLHFILPGCFRRAVRKEDKEGCSWDYADAPDRWAVTRMVLHGDQKLSYKSFIVESNYIGLDNSGSVAIPYLSDTDVSHRFLGRCYEYQKERNDTEGTYLDKLTAMGAGDPYFAAFYPNCHSVFGFYDDMSGVEEESDVSYFVCGYFSNASQDPFCRASLETFSTIAEELGFIVEDKGFYTDHCVLFGEVCNLRWRGYSADYPSGRPEGEINCGIGNTSAEVLSAVISRAVDVQDKTDAERLFNALQYELADELEEIDGISHVEDAIHAQTFARRDGGKIWKLEFHDSDTEALPEGAGLLLAALNRAARQFYKKQEVLSFWQDGAYAAWYSYMLRYEGDDTPSPEKENMQKEIFRICREVIPQIEEETAQIEKEMGETLAALNKVLMGTGITVGEEPDEYYLEPKEPVLLLYGDGVKRNYAFADEGNILCQSSPVTKLTDGEKMLQKMEILKYAGDIPEILPGFDELFAQAMCLNRKIVEMIGSVENIPELACDRSGVSELAGREFIQSWLTFFIEWKISFYPSRTLSEESDDSMHFWKFDGLDYDDPEPCREMAVIYSGRNMITPHALFQLEYVAKKYLSRGGALDEEIIRALEQVKKLPVLSQSLDGLNQQFLSRRQTLQAPIIGNDSDKELTGALLQILPPSFEKTAVNDMLPFFPLRAGHIHVEKVNVISTFGGVQNVFVKEMNPVYSEVIGEYRNAQQNRDYGLLRPRIMGGARFHFDFVTAKDDALPAPPVPETTPVCGIILPELLNGRLALYSAEGSYYGSLKTVYRSGKRKAAWISSTDRPEAGFEDIVFEDEHFKNIIRCLLEDSEKGGTAYSDLFALIQELLDKTLPAGMDLGEELSCIWGRPLAVFQCRVSLERKGALAYSQLSSDFGKYKDLSAGEVEFPLMVGDMDRSLSGIAGYFESYNYQKLYPAYHATAFSSDYIRFGENTMLRINDDEKILTVISEMGNELCFQTGILPVFCCRLQAAHIRGACKVKLCFEADGIVCTPGNPDIPVPAAGAGEAWYFEYTDRQAAGEKNKKAGISGNGDVFQEEKAMICDGYLVLEKEEKKGGEE